MLVHPWDAALSDDEWRGWLAAGNDFGQFVAPGGPARELPVVVPTHFLFDGDGVFELHFARPNPVWAALAERPRALLTVIGDYAFVPSTWGAAPGTPPERGIATSYYASVQVAGDVEVVDEPAALLALLTRQLAHFQPEGGHAPLDPSDGQYARMLPGIRGVRLHATAVAAKFKYAGNKSHEHRLELAGRLAERDAPGDRAARAHLLRRDAAQP